LAFGDNFSAPLFLCGGLMSNRLGEPGNGDMSDSVLSTDPSLHPTGELFTVVYEQLRALARRRMAEERVDHTLQTTGLVHEAYLRLEAGGQVKWSSRGQFFLAAAEAMRRILIEHARARGKLKRGGGRQRVLLNVLDLASDEQIPEILALDEALSRLEEVSPDVAAVVRLRFYAGLSVEETAQALGVSARTVKREWTYARAILYRELSEPAPGNGH
jgi:RNA polymerase sigma factor (TIGR02999 family)